MDREYRIFVATFGEDIIRRHGFDHPCVAEHSLDIDELGEVRLYVWMIDAKGARVVHTTTYRYFSPLWNDDQLFNRLFNVLHDNPTPEAMRVVRARIEDFRRRCVATKLDGADS
ncbi:hypothetical protein LZC95_07870 [Pendulispora brunnea]|uniref:Uncharacterized protein n=1 Tax=Pendulispora brunnea TaxID=2905690 RepID=A0ABZ2KDH6_9BACT